MEYYTIIYKQDSIWYVSDIVENSVKSAMYHVEINNMQDFKVVKFQIPTNFINKNIGWKKYIPDAKNLISSIFKTCDINSDMLEEAAIDGTAIDIYKIVKRELYTK